MNYNTVIFRYDELGLKGKNRIFFEQKLVNNLRCSLGKFLEKDIVYKIINLRGRIIFEREVISQEILGVFSNLIGVSSFSPALRIKLDFELIKKVSFELIERLLEKNEFKNQEQITFRVMTSRGNKAFRLNSMEVDRFVAEHILPSFPKLKVDLVNAQVVLGIEIREKAYIYLEKIEGQRGLPVGSSGKMLSLLSGGIDSPVASYLMIKRGARLNFINFHSPPYIGEESKGKVLELAKILNKFQLESKLYVINFSNIQSAIKLNCQERYRTILYRRAMMRIATQIAMEKKYSTLITGEVLGQVASQTVANMTSINNAAGIPILRPLISYDKVDVIRIAKKIGTYETSILPYPDSCTVFSPSSPATSSKIFVCENEEKLLDYTSLLKEALETMDIIKI